MTKKQNCWDIKGCGRQPGGARVMRLGVCPATTDTETDGLNGGTSAGRICWAVAGTLCGDKVQGSYAQKRLHCEECDVFARIRGEEGTDFVLLPPGKSVT